MKQLLAVAINALKIEFADRSTWWSFLVLPLLFTAVIGVATGGLADPDADPRIPVALVAPRHDGGELARDFAAALAASTVVRVEAMDEAAAQAAFGLGEEGAAGSPSGGQQVAAVITLPEGFTDALLAGENVEVALQAVGDNRAPAVAEEVRAAATRVSSNLLAARLSVEEALAIRPFTSAGEQEAYFREALALAAETSASPPVTFTATLAPEVNERLIAGGFALSSPGQLVTWVLATLLAGAAVLASERSAGTLRRLVTTPAPRWTILGGKISGRFAMGFVQMVVMAVAGALIFGVEWGRSPLALLMVAVGFGLAATALGLFLATLAKTAEQAAGWASLGTFLLAPLGGAWIPLEITPPTFQLVAKALPTTWAMRGFTDVIVRGQGPQGVLLETLVLLGFALLFLLLGVVRFRYE